MFVGTPLYAISRSNWSPGPAEWSRISLPDAPRDDGPRFQAGLELFKPTKNNLMTSNIINRSACLAELASNPKSFSNCPDLHGGRGLVPATVAALPPMQNPLGFHVEGLRFEPHWHSENVAATTD